MKDKKQDRATAVLDELSRLYPIVKPTLNFHNPYETLIATILSAQCTDKRVNMVTERLFELFPTPADMAKLEPEELEPHIKSCGVYRNKAKNIVATCRELVANYNSKVPDTMEELTKLPGVGRKTANVVMANAFGKETIAVDTHVFRVSNRIGIVSAPDVYKTELQLMEAIPQELWATAHLWIIYHGRRVCGAIKPACDRCTLAELCDYAKNPVKKEKRRKKATDTSENP